ncbi:MAG TPA: hypothetical protein VF161_06775 [Steroidobacteraceae bacterium]
MQQFFAEYEERAVRPDSEVDAEGAQDASLGCRPAALGQLLDLSACQGELHFSPVDRM